MKKQFLKMGIVVIAGLLFLASCSNTAHIEKTKGVNLSNYKTYNWVADDADQRNAKVNRQKQMREQNIRNAIDKQLQKNGWTLSATDPDVLVSADLVVERNQRQQRDAVYSQPFTRTYFNRFSRRFNTFYYPSQFMGYDTYSTTVKEGTITVTLIDAKTDKAVWQGWATNELSSNQPSFKDIDKNVKSIFKKFDAGN